MRSIYRTIEQKENPALEPPEKSPGAEAEQTTNSQNSPLLAPVTLQKIKEGKPGLLSQSEILGLQKTKGGKKGQP